MHMLTARLHACLEDIEAAQAHLGAARPTQWVGHAATVYEQTLDGQVLSLAATMQRFDESLAGARLLDAYEDDFGGARRNVRTLWE